MSTNAAQIVPNQAPNVEYPAKTVFVWCRTLAGQFTGIPGVVSLAPGFPPDSLFPYASLSFSLCDGTNVSLPADATATAQQYNTSLRGQRPLLDWVTAHVAALHRPPGGHEVLITNGANHALELITSLFLDRGDAIIMEEFSYPVMSESIAQPKGYRALGVAMDAQGIIPAALKRVLEDAWAAEAAGGPLRPKLLYTIPTGHNPTGCTTPWERRREIYALCRQYDVWILEDDPYYYLQWGPGGHSGTVSSGNALGLTGLLAGAGCVVPSYLSMDVDERVIRVDTFSKFLAPGVRLGWVTARGDVSSKLTSALQTHTVGPCSLSQAVVAATLQTWGSVGLDAHLRRIQVEYAARCAALLAAAKRELTGLAEWRAPDGGMFLWVKLLCGVEDSTEVWEALRDAKVVVCPGRAMHCAGDDVGVKCPYVRVSFSAASEAELAEGMARLGAVLRQHAAARSRLPSLEGAESCATRF